jgi:uncharacterized GH25 family protein
MKRPLVLFTISILSVLCLSHELFLKTDAYFLAPGQASELYLFNGTFDKSENSITTDRITDVTILGPNYSFGMDYEKLYEKENATYLKFSAGTIGTYVAGVSTAPRTLQMNAEDFNDYLDHEGLVGTLKERDQDGSKNNGANEKYSKHVKSVLQVGETKTEDYKTILNYPIEFVPLSNPYGINVGESISFKLLRDGKPLGNHVVHYSTSMPGKDAHENETSTQTDTNGVVTMTPTQSGNWYVATIHMQKSYEDGIDYESNWATLTFGVK